MSTDKREILRRVPLFAGLGESDIDAVLGVLQARRGAPGDILFRQGDPGDALVVVLEGHVVARVVTADGSEAEIARMGAGEIVGELAFLDSEPRSATIATPEGALVLAFTRRAMAKLRESAPKCAAAIYKNVLAGITKRLRDAGERMQERSSLAPASQRTTDAPRSVRTATAKQLRTLPALTSYSDEDLELLAYVATLRSFGAGATLMTEGTPGDSCFLLVAGAVSVTRVAQGVPLAALGPGALVGQLALIDRAPRSASVTASKETMALEIRAEHFTNLVSAASPIALRFQEQVAIAGARQLRIATRKLAAGKRDAAPASVRGLDDWDDDDGPSSLDLDLSPRSR